eukprot:TRINITY_DN64050_c0_g1_i1.p1 TRINITY_DN64050_c0_g1~~TRINITY_DN64050_c0_g1_i1.p1  ORF type:complete len:426 (+),score=91.14 TRINITY_DN64050_c0_g1_i1:126-1403(+)
MLDAGLILYVGLLVLFVWRFLSGWRLCGAWLEYANYCMLLYGLLFFLNIWAIVAFLSLASTAEGKQVWGTLPGIAHPLMMGAPAAALIVYIMAFLQTGQHVNEIRRGAGVLKHDRAVQIIALPAVFGCMAMNALAKMFECAAKVDIEDALAGSRMGKNATAAIPESDMKQLYKAQTETCYQVGDLYEAWALFQFCRMTMEILRSSLKRISREQPTAGSGSELQQEAKGLLVAHSALDDIAYVGVFMFLAVCLSEAGWSLYLLTFSSSSDWTGYNSSMGKFQAAGLVSSAAAIYNVNKVEFHFHSYFQGYGPLLKFLTVKILLSLAYFQKGCIYVLQAVNSTLPGLLQHVVNDTPFLHEIVNMEETEFFLLYSSVVLYECVLGVILHWFAWPADESFYNEEPLEDKEGGPALTKSEQRPLIPTLMP